MNENFTCVSQPHGEYWLHKTQDYFITLYEKGTYSRKSVFIAYRSVVPSRGRYPWTVDNRRFGQFHTLEEAMAFAENFK